MTTNGRQIIVQMHGEPGSGKSTIARELGRALGAIVLDKDVIKAALLRTGVVESQAAPAAYEAFFGVAADLAAQRRSLVLDNPVYWPRIEETWIATAERQRAARVMIECVCPDRVELARRLAVRESLESQPRVPFAPRRASIDFEPASPRLVLDTLRPIDENVGRVLAYIAEQTDIADLAATSESVR
jgi:predicted kinase